MTKLLKTKSIVHLLAHLNDISQQVKWDYKGDGAMFWLFLGYYGFGGGNIFDGLHIFGCTPLKCTSMNTYNQEQRLWLLFNIEDDKTKWFLPTSFDQALLMIQTMILIIDYMAWDVNCKAAQLYLQLETKLTEN